LNKIPYLIKTASDGGFFLCIFWLFEKNILPLHQNLKNTIMECKEKIEENQEMQENAQVVEVVDYKDKYVRLLADMDNLRKHTSKQIENATISAN